MRILVTRTLEVAIATTTIKQALKEIEKKQKEKL